VVKGGFRDNNSMTFENDWAITNAKKYTMPRNTSQKAIKALGKTINTIAKVVFYFWIIIAIIL
jgi:hypothetical protein